MDLTYIGKNIRILRKAKKLTTTALKEITGISPGNLSEIERGIKLPSCNAIISLKKALSCSYDWLLSDHSPYEGNEANILETAILQPSTFRKCDNYLDTECLRLFHELPDTEQIDLLTYMNSILYKNKIVQHVEGTPQEMLSPSVEKNDVAGTA